MAGKSVRELRKQARAKRSRADRLWKDAPNYRLDDRFKKPFLNKVKRLYEEADRLDKEADKLSRR